MITVLQIILGVVFNIYNIIFVVIQYRRWEYFFFYIGCSFLLGRIRNKSFFS